MYKNAKKGTHTKNPQTIRMYNSENTNLAVPQVPTPPTAARWTDRQTHSLAAGRRAARKVLEAVCACPSTLFALSLGGLAWPMQALRCQVDRDRVQPCPQSHLHNECQLSPMPRAGWGSWGAERTVEGCGVCPAQDTPPPYNHRAVVGQAPESGPSALWPLTEPRY